MKTILMVAFGVRLAWYLFILFTNPEGFWLYDSNGYWNIAYNMHEYGVYSRDADLPLLPDYFRTPLYPFLIYPTLYFDSTGNSIPIIQLFLDCFTCYFVYRIVHTITQNTLYAKTGAFMYAIHVPAIVMANYVLCETTFAFLITGFTFLLLQIAKKFTAKHALFTGTVGGLAVLCKPLAFVLIFPAVLYVFYVTQKNMRNITLLLVMVLGFYAVQFPWMQRNKNEFGRYFNSVIGEHLLLGYHASYIYAKANNIPFAYAQDVLRDKFVTNLNYDPYKRPYEYAKLIEQKAYGILWSNKKIFISAHLQECVKFFIWPMGKYIGYQLGERKIYTPFVQWFFVGVQITLTLFFMVIFIWYVVARLTKKIHGTSSNIVLLAGIIILFSQFTTMPYTDARMRFPVEAILISLAFICLFYIQKRGKT